MARILIADSDSRFVSALKDDLQARAWDVDIVHEATRTLAYLGAKHYDVAVIASDGIGGRGMEILSAVRKEGIRVGVVMVSSHAVVDEGVQAIKAGAQEFVTKPIAMSHLSYLICRLLQQRCGSPHYLANRLDLYIREHCSCPALDLEALCAHFRISSRYASRLLGKHVGSSFRFRLLYYRVQRAKGLIEATDLPLYAIAAQCGFRSPGRLAEAFHQLEGLPPRRYRSLYKG